MTLFGNLDFEASEIFVLAWEKPDEFAKFAEADNMISLCAAIENVYNTEMFLMGKTNTCYISCPSKDREALMMDVFLVNAGLKSEISLNSHLFKQAVATIKKIEDLVDTKKDGSQRLPNAVGVAHKLGACIDFNHLADTRIRFGLQNIIEISSVLLEKSIERREKIARRRLTEKTVKRENFKLPTIKADSISKIPSFKILFQKEKQEDCLFVSQTLDCFFLKMKSEMEKESNRVFPKENGVFQRIRVCDLPKERHRNTVHVLSLRFDGRRDVGPRGVFVVPRKIASDRAKLYITDKEEGEENDLGALLEEKLFKLRVVEALVEGEVSETVFKECKSLTKNPSFGPLQKVSKPHGVRDQLNAFYCTQDIVLSQSTSNAKVISKKDKKDLETLRKAMQV